MSPKRGREAIFLACENLNGESALSPIPLFFYNHYHISGNVVVADRNKVINGRLA